MSSRQSCRKFGETNKGHILAGCMTTITQCMRGFDKRKKDNDRMSTIEWYRERISVQEDRCSLLPALNLLTCTLLSFEALGEGARQIYRSKFTCTLCIFMRIVSKGM